MFNASIYVFMLLRLFKTSFFFLLLWKPIFSLQSCDSWDKNQLAQRNESELDFKMIFLFASTEANASHSPVQ